MDLNGRKPSPIEINSISICQTIKWTQMDINLVQ